MVTKLREQYSVFFIFTILFTFLLSFSPVQTVNYLSVSSNVKAVNTFPVVVTCDYDFSLYQFPGLGTSTHPYRIENFVIHSSASYGIHITNTTRPFIIQNCFISSVSVGILISDVAPGTAQVENNTCSDNEIGIKVLSTQSVEVKDNYLAENINGVVLDSSLFSDVTNNEFNSNDHYGIFVNENSLRNSIHHNLFINNGYTPQAFDSGYQNNWDFDGEGNFWSDNPLRQSYSISGDSDSVDNFPLNKNLEIGINPILVISLSSFAVFLLVLALVISFIIMRKKHIKLRDVIEKIRAGLKKNKKPSKVKKLKQPKEIPSINKTEAIFISIRLVRLAFAKRRLFICFLSLLTCCLIATYPILLRIEEELGGISSELELLTIILFILGILLTPIVISSKQSLKTDYELFEKGKEPIEESIVADALKFYFVLITLFIFALIINAVTDSRSPKVTSKTAAKLIVKRKPFTVGKNFLFLLSAFFFLLWYALEFFVQLIISISIRFQIIKGDKKCLKNYIADNNEGNGLGFSINYYRRIRASIFKIKLL